MGRRNFSSVVTLSPPYSLPATSLLCRSIRHEKGWTLAEMHRATGVHENLLRDYEQGKRRPSPDSWAAILKGAGIDPACLGALFSATEEMAAAFSGARPQWRLRATGDFLTELEDLAQSCTTFLEKAPDPDAGPPDPEDQLRRLLACEPSLRTGVIRISAEFHNQPLALLCCERSNAAQDPESARELAEIAAAVTDAI